MVMNPATDLCWVCQQNVIDYVTGLKKTVFRTCSVTHWDGKERNSVNTTKVSGKCMLIGGRRFKMLRSACIESRY